MSIWTRNRRHIIPRKKINSYFSKTSEYLMASIDNKHYCIHKLLAETFIENPNNYPVVDHLDGNKINNNLDNLEWCSHSENTKRAYDNGLCSRNRKVLCVEENIIFNSCRDAGKWLGNESKSSHILQVGNGKRKTAYGYHWKFV